MRSITTASALCALSALASATSSSSSEPTTTLSIPFPGINPTDLGLSVITVAPSSTIFKVGCALNRFGEPRNDQCHWTGGLHPYLTIGPSSLGFNITGDRDALTYECEVSSTSQADCTTVAFSGTRTTKETQHRITLTYGPATVTGGLGKLLAAASTTSTTRSSSVSSTTSSTSTSASNDVGAAGASPSSSSSSGAAAAARETGLGLLAVAGAVGAGLVL